MTEIERFEELKEKVEKHEKDVARREGGLGEWEEALSQEFKIDNLKEGERLLKKLTQQDEIMVTDINDMLDEYEEQCPEEDE